MKRGEARWHSSGFVGKGFTFDAEEMNEGQKVGGKKIETEKNIYSLFYNI